MLRAKLHEQEIRRVIGAPGFGERSVDGVASIIVNANRCLYFLHSDPTPETRDAIAGRDECILIVPAGSGMPKLFDKCVVLEADDPRAAIAKVLGFIRDENRAARWVTTRHIAASAQVSPLAVVEGDVEIGEDAVVEPFCVIGPDVRIGRGSILRSGARIYPHVEIGEYSTVGSNTVIAPQGFGFVRDDNGNKTRIPHLGGVVIGSHVDIGGVSAIQTGTIEPTIIEDYVKIAEHVMVGHNVRIGRGASITSGVIIGGHASIAEEAWLGINSTIRDGLSVGAYSLVGMDVSLQQDLPERAVARAPRADVSPRAQVDPTTIGFKRP